MSTPLLSTKLYIPPLRPNLVSRPRLIERLNEGKACRLALISAPAGFGKTTLLSECVAGMSRRVAWLSLDKGDNDLSRFLAYLVAALQTVEGELGQGLLAALQSPGTINVEAVLTTLINEIAAIPDSLVLILDDYHVIESQAVDGALAFLLDHLPPPPGGMHLVIASRIEPTLPLSRLRARGQLTELREGDLRFTTDEAAAFLKQAVPLPVSSDAVRTLESRTEGWITGLQLAAVAMQGLEQRGQIAHFVHSFGGSHRYVIDYLVDEVLDQQTSQVLEFLLQTSVLDRMNAPLCNAVRFGMAKAHSGLGDSRKILEQLEAANLFLIPLDGERCWYRYHHLFSDLLRQRLHQQQPDRVAELHLRASEWYEENGLLIEAFRHAAAADDLERTVRLVRGDGMPLYFRGEVTAVLNWLESLPKSLLDARPALWVMYAEVLQSAGRFADIEKVFQAAEAALQGAEPDAHTRDLLGTIASMRATMLIGQREIEGIIALSRRALELVLPNNLVVRAAANWVLGYGYQMGGDRAAAGQAYAEALAISQATDNMIVSLLATTGLGNLEAADNRLYQAARTYRRALQVAGEHPLPLAAETYLGLARVCYEWNDLDAAQRHGKQSVQLARQMETSDIPIAGQVLLARLKLARGDVGGAVAILDEANQSIRQQHFIFRIPEVAAVQILTLLRQDDLPAAAHLAQAHDLPVSQARVHLAGGDATAALAVLEPLRQQMEVRGWQDEILKVMVLQAVALRAEGEKDNAVQLLGDALALAEPGGSIRTFVDEGALMAHLLRQAAARAIMPGYTGKLLAAFEGETNDEGPRTALLSSVVHPWSLIEPLSPRELEVLQLVAQGLSNREIGERLFLALDTVKGHNRRIYAKLQVTRRTEAVARARELGLL